MCPVPLLLCERLQGHAYESKLLPRSLLGANIRAVYPTASWADSFNSPRPSSPLHHWPHQKLDAHEADYRFTMVQTTPEMWH